MCKRSVESSGGVERVGERRDYAREERSEEEESENRVVVKREVVDKATIEISSQEPEGISIVNHLKILAITL